MLLRIRFILLSLFAIAAVSVLASASASAIGRVGACETASVIGGGQWSNSECTLTSGAKEYETKEITSGTEKGTGGEAVLTSELGGAEVSIICAKGKSTNEIEPGGATGSGEATFETCTVGNSKERFVTCEVPNVLVKFTSQLIEQASELRAELKPNEEGKTRFTNIVIKNKGSETCLVKGTFPVTGTAFALIPNANTLKILHLLDFSLADNKSLKLNGKAATLSTSISINVLRGTGALSRYVPFDILH
jgi:hypothetical protein